MVKLIRICVLVLAVNLVAGTAAFAAPGFTLINVKHACGGQSNGSFDIRVNTVTGSPSGLRFEVLIFAAPPQIVVTEDITPMPGLPYVYAVTGLAGADYVVRVTQLGTGSSATVLPLTISDFTVDLVAVTPNTDATCGSPNGAIDVTTNGSSNAGPITYTWTEAGGATYNTEDIANLPGGDYTLSYTDQPAGATTCTLGPIHVDDPVASPFHISSTDPAICVGEDLALEVDVSDIGYTYDVMEGVAVLASSVGNGGTLVINVPGLAAGNHTLTVSASQGCPGTFNLPADLDVVVDVNPTITTGPTNQEVCEGITSAIITYSATTGSPDLYSIDFDLAAEAANFVDVAGAALAPLQITIDVPSDAPVATYNAILTVTNSVTGCVSANIPITIKVNANPVIVPGADPSVCAGVTTAFLPYGGAVGANEYSLDFDVAAEAENFADIGPLALPATPIGIAVPALAAPGTYNATLRVITTATACFTDYPITVTVIANPTIALGANPAVCFGTPTANLTYTSTTADEYTIDFDVTAEGEGFVDVTPFTALAAGPSQIAIAIPVGPGDGDPGIYLADLIVRNSATLCTTTIPIQVTINGNPTITPVSVALQVCRGTTSVNLPFSAVTDSPDQYSLDFDNTAQTALFADVTNNPLGATPIIIVVPATAAVGTYNVLLSVRNSAAGCVSGTTAITIEVLTTPIVSPGAVPAVCSGFTATSIPYSVTAGTPDQYSIDYDAVANGQSFVDVGPLALPGVAVPVAVPAGAAPGLYNGTLRISDSGNGCFSDYAFTVLINPLPTITAVADPQVCLGAAATSLTYTSTANGANQFSIVYGAGAIADGFLDVTNLAFTAPAAIPITIPLTATATTYTGDLTVRNSVTGCVSVVEPFQITINPNPTLTPGANPSVCAGTTSADLTFAALVGGDQYSIDFNGAANTAGFIDVAATGPLTSPITIAVPALAAANTYSATLRVITSATSCFTDYPITVTVIANPTITLGANPAVCSGIASADLTYTATTGDEYRLDFDAIAEGVGFVDDIGFVALAAGPSQITIAVPPAGAAATYDANLIIRNTVTTCTSTVAIQVTIIPLPTITGVADPQVCLGAAATSLTYTSTANGANQFSIVYGAGAIADGFLDVTNIPFTAPAAIPIAIPLTATATTYTGDLTVRNSVTGCVSVVEPFQITINPNPTLTPGANPSVCAGTTSADLTFAALVGGDQYSIDFNGAANTAGFIDVAATGPLTSPITIAVPALAAANTYSATLRVITSATSCFTDYPITVTVIANPTITLGANPAVCSGIASADLTYTVTTGDEYRLDFDVIAEGVGFVDDIGFVALAAGPSQITIAVPPAGAAATYDANLIIRNTVTTCTSTVAVQVTILPLPTITGVADPQVCLGAAATSLTYTSTANGPNQFSIVYGAGAIADGFLDVTNIAFTTPAAIPITIPVTATAITYTGDLTVRNSVTGCVSVVEPFQITINPNPTLTPGANPSVCAGTTSADLTFSALVGGDQYSIDFNGAANTAGFIDVGATGPLTSPITIAVPALAAANTYSATLRVITSATSCFTDYPITVTVIANPTITLGANPAVCSGVTTANLTYSATTANEYEIDFDVIAQGQGFVDVTPFAIAAAPSQIAIAVPAGAAPATYDANLIIRNTVTTCTSTVAIQVTIISLPTIIGVVDPQVCLGATVTSLTYTATTNGANQFSIVYGATALADGFVNVSNLSFVSPAAIPVTIPPTAVATVYTADLTVRNSATGCVSAVTPVTITINGNPTLTLGPNPMVCLAGTNANLTYTATTASPDQYFIDFDAAAETAGFTDITLALPVSPISIPVPAATPFGVYNATITASNTVTSCVGTATAFTITVGIDATLGAIAPVCMNTSADIPYTPVIGSPDVYSIDFDATAEAAGFVDVVDAALPVASITVAVPPNVAGVFNGSLTVKNSTSGCVSSVKPVALTIGTTITLGPDPAICEGITTADLTYLATTGVPDQYSIDFDVIAEGAGFVDVTDVALTASPIVIVVPATAPAATYSYTVSVRNSANGCSSILTPKTLIINSLAAANAGLDETICAGTTYFLVGSSVGSSALTGAWTITSQPAGGDGALSSSAQVADPTTINFSATVVGDYVLTLMTDDPAGPCVPAQDDVTITITSIPVVALGQTKTICGNDDVAYEILLTPLNFPANTLLSWPDPDGGGPATAGVNVPVGPAGTIHINDRLINHSLSNIGVTYQVTPSVGLCVGIQENITIVVQPSPVLQDLQATTICSGDVVGYEILLNPVNTPAGTMFSWPDPDGAGSGTSQLNIVADPAGKIHITDTLYNGTAAAIHVIYSIIATAPNGCRAVPRDIDVTVNPGAVVEAGSAQSICSSGTATLAGSSIGGLATAGTWSIFASPAGGDGSLSVTTATATPDVVTFTATVAGSYTLRLTTDDPAGSCLAVSEDVVITVRPSSDPACVGGVVGTGDCTTVVIVPKPSPATCSNSDGSIIFTIKPFVPALLTTEVRIDIVGISPSNNTITRTVHNDSTFNNLPVGIYDYSIEYGDPSCIKTGQVTIDRSGTVDVPVFSNPVDPVCFGVASGSVTIDVPGETGNPLEWSVDGIVWTPFIAGNTVAGMPAGSNIISVRRSSADACASGANLTLANPTQIVTTLTPSNATCNNNDGTITVGTVTGGTGPYSYALNGQAVILPADNILTGLVAGNQVLVVTDAVGCSATFIASVIFPGYVNHTTPVITQPDCTGAGGNGVISLQILDAGSFEFGITLDQVLEPTTYNPTGGANVTISNLPNGNYAVWLRSMSAGVQCATKEGNLLVAGVYPVSAQATNTSAVCFNDKAAIQITTVSGAPNLDYIYELTNTSDNSVVSGAITASQSLAPFTINNIDAGNYSLRIRQDQSSINASCTAPIVSAPVALLVDGPTALLDTLSVVRKVSYPDLANGTANVIVNPSGQEPYEARLELVQPADPTQAFVQDWTVVNVNPQTLKFEYKFQDLFAGLYELRLRDAFGCERVFDLAIGSETAIMIPNIFTPNGDKVNDVFFIRNLPSDVTVVITNRWGKEVFKSNSYDNTWDGGNSADGVYYYRINFPDKSMTGWVEILRGQ